MSVPFYIVYRYLSNTIIDIYHGKAVQIYPFSVSKKHVLKVDDFRLIGQEKILKNNCILVAWLQKDYGKYYVKVSV